MRLVYLWYFTIIGITMMIVGTVVFEASGTVGTFMGLTGVVLFMFPLYYALRTSQLDKFIKNPSNMPNKSKPNKEDHTDSA